MMTQVAYLFTSILPCSVLGWLIAMHPGQALPTIPGSGTQSTWIAQTPVPITPTSSPSISLCPEPALSRLSRHTIASGETLDEIAQRYGLLSATLLGFNPSLRGGTVPVGAEIIIPPYDGIRVETSTGATWRQLATTYSVRADALFEVNGCREQVPSVVFIPGVNWSPNGVATNTTANSTNSNSANSANSANRATNPTPGANNPLSGYPLPAVSPIVTAYGWYIDPNSGERVFQTGVDLAAEAGTSVLAVGSGTVAFAGQQGNYGNLVVINHSQGLQTRYAQLGNIAVQVGQTVQAGDRLGTIGAPTGAMPTTSYLHFEVRSNSEVGWVAQDPGVYIEAIRSANPLN